MKVLLPKAKRTVLDEGSPLITKYEFAPDIAPEATAEGERTSRELVNQADPMQTHVALDGNMQSAALVVVANRPFLPKADKVYETRIEWNGATHTARFSADADVVEFMRNRGHRLDLQKLAIVRSDKSWDPILGTHPWETTLDQVITLQDAPPHLVKEPILVTGVHVFSAGRTEEGHLRTETNIADYAIDLEVFSCKDKEGAVERSAPRALKQLLEVLPISEAELARKSLGEGIEISGVSETSLAVAQPSIAAVLGKALASWPQTHGALEQELREIRERRTLIETGAIKSENLEKEYGEVLARESELMFKVAPIEIVVVPKGKHWSAMPQAVNHRNKPVVKPSSLGVNLFNGDVTPEGVRNLKRVVFIPEDDPLTQRHELYHLLADVTFTKDQIALLDREYARAVENRGPFARPYGIQRSEFLTTWAELFEGSGGDAGREYLEKKAPSIHDLLRDVTGR